MKTKSIIMGLVLILALCVSACGNKNADSRETINPEDVKEDNREYEEAKVISTDDLLSVLGIDVSEYVKVGDYKSISITLDGNYEVTDDEVKEYLNSYLSNNSTYTVTDKQEVEDGDVVNIDFEGKINGETFEGGSAEGQHLEIGSGSFIAGFEDGLIQHKVGEDVVLNLKFPDDYWNEEYAGKDVEFSVKINSIDQSDAKTYDSIDDSYVKETYGYETKQDWYDSVYNSLVSTMEQQRLSDAQVKYFEELMPMANITVPDELIDKELDENLRQMEIYAKDSYDATVEEYLAQYEGYDSIDAYKDAVREEVEENLKEQLVIDYIIQAEGITITEGGYKEFLAYYLDAYGMEEDAFYERYGSKETIMLIYAENMTISNLIDNALK